MTITFKKVPEPAPRTDGFIMPGMSCSATGCNSDATTMVVLDGLFYGGAVCDNEAHVQAAIAASDVLRRDYPHITPAVVGEL